MRPYAMPPLLSKELWFPDPATAVTDGDLAGLVAFGGDLSVERLLLAYRSGIFPWAVDPVTWWSPDPRGIIPIGHDDWPRSLRKLLRKEPFRVTFDTAFQQVIEGCADAPRPGGWISDEFVETYTRLHEAGHAHSVECWQGDKLAGGVYGVAIGGLFAGESMFHRRPNASKVALFHLLGHLRERGFTLFDTQMVTGTTRRLGAIEIRRRKYLALLAKAVAADCRFA
jgi:leucyl/phenylalanyl-tRNA--protein transferase